MFYFSFKDENLPEQKKGGLPLRGTLVADKSSLLNAGHTNAFRLNSLRQS